MVKGLCEVETAAAVFVPLAEIQFIIEHLPSSLLPPLTWSRRDGWSQDCPTEINRIWHVVINWGGHCGCGSACKQLVRTTLQPGETHRRGS